MYSTRRLRGDDLAEMKALLRMFGDVFDDPDNYHANVPDDAYLLERLADNGFFAVVASAGDTIVGGLAAYELRKFEQERSEIYIYDLAVVAQHRRQGVATALIRALGEAARAQGAYVMFVQADNAEEDAPARALYEKLASEHIVAHHYDIEP